MDDKNRDSMQPEGRTKRSQAQVEECLMARLRVAERERAAGASRDAFEALAELETKLGLA